MSNWYLEPVKDFVRTDSRVKYKTDSRRLKFCEQCQMVWEFVHHTATCHKYKNFPTYKLTRKTCHYCKKEKE